MNIDYDIGVKRITEVSKCDCCGSTTVKETRKWNQHSNGYWNESIKFSCGREFEFTPNFMSVGAKSPCQNDKAWTARKEAVEETKAAIFKLAEKRGLHPDDLNRLKSSLEYWNVTYYI